MASQPQQEIDLSTLGVPQLEQLKKSLEKDVEALSDNFAQLREAQARFSESAEALASIPPDGPGRDVLVPLTGSMYVPGTLGGAEEVLVDVGTGFYVGKSVSAASAMLARKASDLKANTESLAKVVTTKRANLEAVTGMLEERTAQHQQQQQQQQQGGGGGR